MQLVENFAQIVERKKSLLSAEEVALKPSVSVRVIFQVTKIQGEKRKKNEKREGAVSATGDQIGIKQFGD